MNLQSLVVVILRLLSLNFFLQVAYQMAPRLLRFIEMHHVSQRLSQEEPRSLFVLPWLLVLGLLLGGVLVWIFASSIARLVTRGLPPDVSLGTLSLTDCYSIAFMGVGLFYIASHFPHVLNWTHYLLKMAASRPDGSWRDEVKWYDVWDAFVPFVVGIILFVQSRKWAVALACRHVASASPIAPSNEQLEGDV